MYTKIVNPKTGRKVNIKSRLGRKILKNYLVFSHGGASAFSFINEAPVVDKPTSAVPKSSFAFINETPGSATKSSLDTLDELYSAPPSLLRSNSGVGDVASFHGTDGILEISKRNAEQRKKWREWCDKLTDEISPGERLSSRQNCHYELEWLTSDPGTWERYMDRWKRKGEIPPDFRILEEPSFM